MLRFALTIVIWFVAHATVHAHELRPAYLELHETAADQFSVMWKVPAIGERRLALNVRFPEGCKDLQEPATTFQSGAYIERSRIACSPSLRGRKIAIDGLRTSLTDALVRVETLDGAIQVARLMPETPEVLVTGRQSTVEIAKTYVRLGIEHILQGYDHLLFVLALMLLIGNRWMLLKTVTAFTLAHSITLAGATFGWFSLPQLPVEACIALSISFVAAEILRNGTRTRDEGSAATWIMAFAFGLLHGFGFAGALQDVGLPHGDVPLALLTFNLGVEAGQLLFIGCVLLLSAGARSLFHIQSVPVTTLLGYTIGTVSMFWLLERLTAFSS